MIIGLSAGPTNQFDPFPHVMSSLIHVLGKFSEGQQSKYYQVYLTMKLLFVRLPKRRWTLLVYVVSINSYELSLKCVVQYLHDLIISLIPMWFGSFIYCLRRSMTEDAHCMCHVHRQSLPTFIRLMCHNLAPLNF